MDTSGHMEWGGRPVRWGTSRSCLLGGHRMCDVRCDCHCHDTTSGDGRLGWPANIYGVAG